VDTPYGAEYNLYVYEKFEEVVMAVGTSLAACMCYAGNFFFAGERFEKKGIKYFPELFENPPSNDPQPNQTSAEDKPRSLKE